MLSPTTLQQSLPARHTWLHEMPSSHIPSGSLSTGFVPANDSLFLFMFRKKILVGPDEKGALKGIFYSENSVSGIYSHSICDMLA
jgi:hypothetical protein